MNFMALAAALLATNHIHMPSFSERRGRNGGLLGHFKSKNSKRRQSAKSRYDLSPEEIRRERKIERQAKKKGRKQIG